MLEEETRLSRIERKKDKMRQKITTVAMDLFRKQGFHGTTLEQIAQEVDIAKKTLYNYFPEKEVIICVYLQGFSRKEAFHLDEFIRSYPDIRSCLLAIFEKCAQTYEADPEVWKVYILYRLRNKSNHSKDEELRSGFEGILTKVIEHAQEKGHIRLDIPAKELAQHLEKYFFMTVLSKLNDLESFSLSNSLARCVDIFLNGVTPR